MRLSSRSSLVALLLALLAHPALAAAVPIDLARVPDPARALRFDGGASAPAASAAAWRQLAFELRGADPGPAAWPGPEELAVHARAVVRRGAVPLALLDRGLAGPDGAARRAFAAAALTRRTWRGADVALELPRELVLGELPAGARLELDAGDGLGWRELAPGTPVRARYTAAGTHTLTLRLTSESGPERVARFALEVAALTAPAPDDTLRVTGTVPFRGGVASGSAYVYLAPGHAQVTDPVVVPEGFDLDNSLGADELWALLDQEGLADSLLALGYDAVVLDFDDSTDWIERNAFALVALLEQLRATLPDGTSMAMVGPSMGGLVGRYALAWMEQQGVPHGVRTFVSFDSPHLGANIPLGIQYWMSFFSGQSADAALLLSRLNTPAARQMLLHHLTTPPSSSGAPDSLRAVLEASLAAVGDWPALPRRVAVANGSGAGAGQGFAPGAQIIRYDYNIILARVLGNVWAVPDQVSTRIFDGRIQIPFQTTQTLQVTVAGTLPWDSAPGGWRATMTQMDTTAAPYGDIVALHPHHAFIPTVSALAVAGAAPYEDLLADPALAARTPFDAVYAPLANQDHITVTPENKTWLLDEVTRPLVAAPRDAAPRLALAPAAPHPVAGATRLRFTLPRAGHARLEVYDVHGRRVARLVDAALPAGAHGVEWRARDAAGGAVAPGVYLARLECGGERALRRLVVLR